jgi:hypothetical protein
MGPKNAYKDMLDNVVSLITGRMNHQTQLGQMANGTMFATTWAWALLRKPSMQGYQDYYTSLSSLRHG